MFSIVVEYSSGTRNILGIVYVVTITSNYLSARLLSRDYVIPIIVFVVIIVVSHFRPSYASYVNIASISLTTF